LVRRCCGATPLTKNSISSCGQVPTVGYGFESCPDCKTCTLVKLVLLREGPHSDVEVLLKRNGVSSDTLS